VRNEPQFEPFTGQVIVGRLLNFSANSLKGFIWSISCKKAIPEFVDDFGE